MAGFIIIIIVVIIVVVYFVSHNSSHLSPEEVKQFEDDRKRKNIEAYWDSTNPALVCPHCQTKGNVRTKVVNRKKGISGAKATGALLTGGLSILATGLSRKEGLTQAHCDSCNSTWDF